MVELKPGRELDELVAETMGIPIYEYDQHRGDHDWLEDEANYPYISDSARLILWTEPNTNGQPWNPSEDIVTAMMAWEWLEEYYTIGGICLVRGLDNTPSVVTLDRGCLDNTLATGESYPEAIAKAVVITDEKGIR